MLCGISATPPSAEIHKTALGAENSVAWRYFADTAEAIDSTKAEGYKLVCLEQVQGSVSLEAFRHESDSMYALVLAAARSTAWRRLWSTEADICLEIPQSGTKHSLNVSVSAGVALEILRTSFLFYLIPHFYEK